MSRVEIAPPEYAPLRLTIPVREALVRAGNRVDLLEPGSDLPPEAQPQPLHSCYRVTLCGRVPPGIVPCVIGDGDRQHRGLRLDDEPEYPGEWPASAVAWHERGEWVPCPTCGAALVWYEAGYVPGYRICSAGHRVQLASDGRSAVAQ